MSLPPHADRTRGFIVGCMALAGLGVFELLTGHAGPGIRAAVAVELIVALAFLPSSRKQ